MFDFLSINNDDFLDFSKEHIDNFLNNAQMRRNTKDSVQKEYASFSEQIEESKFYSKNGAVLLWIKLQDTEELSKSDYISVARFYFRLIKSDFVLIELEYKGVKKYVACRKKISDLEIGVNTAIWCNTSPWIYEKNNGSPINDLFLKVKDIYDENDELNTKNEKLVNVIKDSSEWVDIPLETFRNKIAQSLEIRPDLKLFTINKKSQYSKESDKFVEPNTVFHVLLENKLIYKSENDWDNFLNSISSYLIRDNSEEYRKNYFSYNSNPENEFTYPDLLNEDIDEDLLQYYSILIKTESLEGLNSNYTYEKLFILLEELRKKHEPDKLVNAEIALSGSLLRTAIKKNNSTYFELSEKLLAKDHEERCHYGIITKDIMVLEEELKVGIDKYFNLAVRELAKFYVNLDKGKAIIDRAENLLRWLELMKLADLHGDWYISEEISKVANKNSRFYSLVSINMEGNVFLERIIKLIDNDFIDTPNTYSEYLEEIEKLQIKQQALAGEEEIKNQESQITKEDIEKQKRIAIENDKINLLELKEKKQKLEQQISDIEIMFESTATSKDFESLEKKYNFLTVELENINQRIYKASEK